jgi:SHS2 domain-containing protein
MVPVSWEIVDHTGDVALHLRAPDLAGLIASGTRALRELLFPGQPDRDAPPERVELRASGIDREDLLVQALSEVLHALQEGDLDPIDLSVAVFGDTEAEVEIWGQHRPGARIDEIKAVTYHAVELTPRDGEIETTIVLDV